MRRAHDDIDLTQYNPEELGRCIRAARRLLGYSQHGLGQLAYLTHTTIGNIERGGTHRPRRKTLETILGILAPAFVDQVDIVEKALQKFHDQIFEDTMAPRNKAIELDVNDKSRRSSSARAMRVLTSPSTAPRSWEHASVTHAIH